MIISTRLFTQEQLTEANMIDMLNSNYRILENAFEIVVTIEATFPKKDIKLSYEELNDLIHRYDTHGLNRSGLILKILGG